MRSSSEHDPEGTDCSGKQHRQSDFQAPLSPTYYHGGRRRHGLKCEIRDALRSRWGSHHTHDNKDPAAKEKEKSGEVEKVDTGEPIPGRSNRQLRLPKLEHQKRKTDR